MMPTHIITVQSLFDGKEEELEYVANFCDSDLDVIKRAKEVYETRLISVHKVKYEAILTQVF